MISTSGEASGEELSEASGARASEEHQQTPHAARTASSAPRRSQQPQPPQTKSDAATLSSSALQPYRGSIFSAQLRARPGQYSSYSGHALLVTDVAGEITGEGTEGYYFENTRLLSRWQLRVNGQRVKPSGVSPVGGSGFLGYYCIAGNPALREHTLFMEEAWSLDEGMRVHLDVANYAADAPARLTLALHLSADFADIMEAEEGTRKQSAPVATSWGADRQELLFCYQHPDLDRAVAIRVVTAPSALDWHDGALTVEVHLAPHEHAAFTLVVEPIFDGQRRSAPPTLFDPASTTLGRLREELRARSPVVVTTNATVARAWQTATSDLANLPLGLEDGPATPIAGLPLYQQFFGRDSLTISWQALLMSPVLLRDTLRANAAWQGTATDNWRDEQPGKMIHQARKGPLSVLGFNPHERYYGDYATPPDFLSMLGQYLLWTNDLPTVRDLLPAARRAIAWAENDGDLDGDGFLEYVTRSSGGIKNQGWKDSWDAILYEDGTVVPNPIAVCEIQGYWYAALRWSAFAFFLAGERMYALELLGKARTLKQRFDAAFWMADEGFYCLGLDPDKRKIRSIASNAGQLLATGIVPKEKGWRVARRLMQPDMFSGWGVRTLSSEHPAYNPFGYHLGSVWPVEQGTFALGFARYGCWDELQRLAHAVFSATELFAEYRLPEVLSGLPRDQDHPHPGIYPSSNEPQGWSASAVVLFVQSLLGMIPVAPFALLLVDPHLPPWLPSLRLEGIQVGEALVDLEVWRTSGGRTRYRVSRTQGTAHVIRQPPPEGSHSGILARALDALGSLWPFSL